MNLFNCFQAVAFYTLTPFGIQYLFNNGFSAWGYVACIGEFVGFVLISMAIHDQK
jgi:hypothetical protein